MIHEELSSGRWHTMTLAAQLGNIGSEFNRIIIWKKRNDAQKTEAAMARFFELLDLTIADNRWAGARRKELARIRETSAEELENSIQNDTFFSRFFDQFAFLARKDT